MASGRKIEQGTIEQRLLCLERHKRGLHRVIERHKDCTEEAYILIFGHGATHDFVSDALTSGFPSDCHSPFTAPHCAITTISYDTITNSWKLQGFAKDSIATD